MGLANELKRMIFGEEDGYYDDDMIDEDEDIVSVPRQTEQTRAKRVERAERAESNVVNMPMPTSITAQKERLVISRPKTVDDAPSISDCLRMNMICVVNLEGVDHTNAQRIADFVGGAGYALSCDVERVSNDIFIVAPSHVGVSNDLKDDVKNGHILPWISSAFK